MKHKLSTALKYHYQEKNMTMRAKLINNVQFRVNLKKDVQYKDKKKII